MKLLTPPIFELPLPLPIARTAEDQGAVVAQAIESTRQRQANRLQTSDHLVSVAEDPAGESAQFGADHPPEIMLLIEARDTDDGMQWHFGAGRFN